MRRAYLFLGPSLRRDALPNDPRLVPLPPVAQGDVRALLPERPAVIAIIDGRFEGVPAVLHKEILHALAEGVIVLGGSSMGALRAAELHRLGMRGVGRIFAAYAAGELADDDEVAVLHGPADAGFPPLSEAMVDLRATLDRAAATGLIDARTVDRLKGIAKARFYKERTQENLMADAAAAGLEVTSLRAWWRENRVALKAADAQAVVAAALEALDEPAPPKRPFLWTDAYARLDAPAIDLDGDARRVWDELRLQPKRYAALRDRALLKRLAAEAGAVPGPRAASRLRARLGLDLARDWQTWMEAQGLDETGFERLAEGEARLEAIRCRPPPDLARAVLDEARASGAFAVLLKRAADKRAVLAAGDLGGSTPEDLGLDPLGALLAFASGKAGDLPDDLEAWLGAQGFADRDEASRLVLRERLYTILVEQEHKGGRPG